MRNFLMLGFFISVGIIFTFLIFFKSHAQSIHKSLRFWKITAVDTMKYSRDGAENASVLAKIPFFMSKAKKLHVTHVTIDTPYDQQFYPVLSAWVHGARRENLKVWFRGNFSSWEGWFGYPKDMTPQQHLTMTKQFILSHPDLFQNGDIFTPVPEPENGGPGDPRGSTRKSAAFNTFLINSYNTCVSAFAQIHKQVLCGFFSTNADIAKQVLTPQTVKQMGNVIAIDNYVKSPKIMQSDIEFLENKFPTAQIVLGEYGAPIPDINGAMTDSQQEDFLRSMLQVFYQQKDRILGLNYWTLAGSSTELLKNSTQETPAFQTVAHYYLPPQISGQITDTLGNPLGGVAIKDSRGTLLAQTNSQGTYTLPLPPDTFRVITLSHKGYTTLSKTLQVEKNNAHRATIQLAPDSSHWLYRIRLFIKTHLSFF